MLRFNKSRYNKKIIKKLNNPRKEEFSSENTKPLPFVCVLFAADNYIHGRPKTNENKHNDYASVQGGGESRTNESLKSMNETLAHTAKQPMKKFFFGFIF